jgi:hypothetical protein
MAVEAQLAPRRHRSLPVPSGIKAASPTLKIPSHAASVARVSANGNPRKKNWPAPIQFQDLPNIVTDLAGWPGNDCQDHPQTQYTTTATDMAQIAASSA